jgi:hypothetical protein
MAPRTAQSELNALANYLCTQAAQWGADQELEACCEWLAKKQGHSGTLLFNALRAARRPKPPSLKEQALTPDPPRTGGPR